MKKIKKRYLKVSKDAAKFLYQTKMPHRLKLGEVIYVRTKFGSYVDENEDGMKQQKNALSLQDLLILGAKPI